MADKNTPFVEAAAAGARKWALKLGKIVLILIAIKIGIGWVKGRKDAYEKAHPKAATATDAYAPRSKAQEINYPVPKAEAAKQFPRKYSKVYDISRTTESHFVLEVEIPAGEEWVSVALPPWYRVVSSHDVWVEYDWGFPIKGSIKEPPGQSPEGGNIPLAFDARGTGKAGKLIIRGYRQTPEPQPIKKEVKKVSSKKTRIAKKAVHKDLPTSDIPSGQQVM